MDSRRSRALAPLLGAAAILVTVVVFLLLALQSKNVDMPGDDATPEQVVGAYLAALDAHDCDTAMALRTPDSRGTAENWCSKVAHMADARVTGSHSEFPEWSGYEAPDEVVNVRVTFDLGWRMFHNDISMEEGHTDWGYRLVRDSPTSQWRIFDEGNG